MQSWVEKEHVNVDPIANAETATTTTTSSTSLLDQIELAANLSSSIVIEQAVIDHVASLTFDSELIVEGEPTSVEGEPATETGTTNNIDHESVGNFRLEDQRVEGSTFQSTRIHADHHDDGDHTGSPPMKYKEESMDFPPSRDIVPTTDTATVMAIAAAAAAAAMVEQGHIGADDQDSTSAMIAAAVTAAALAMQQQQRDDDFEGITNTAVADGVAAALNVSTTMDDDDTTLIATIPHDIDNNSDGGGGLLLLTKDSFVTSTTTSAVPEVAPSVSKVIPPPKTTIPIATTTTSNEATVIGHPVAKKTDSISRKKRTREKTSVEMVTSQNSDTLVADQPAVEKISRISKKTRSKATTTAVSTRDATSGSNSPDEEFHEHGEQLSSRRMKDRERYASMTPDQRQVYNAKRREQYHRQSDLSRHKRRERERNRYHALTNDLAVDRNTRRAKLERERYQKLTPTELEAKNRARRERAAATRQHNKDGSIIGDSITSDMTPKSAASASVGSNKQFSRETSNEPSANKEGEQGVVMMNVDDPSSTILASNHETLVPSTTKESIATATSYTKGRTTASAVPKGIVIIKQESSM